MVAVSEGTARDVPNSKPSTIVLVILNVSFACLLLAVLSVFRSLGRRLNTFLLRGTVSKSVDKHTALSELRKIRESGVRDSGRVVQLWKSAISGQLLTLGHEKWIILEQVFIAALDIADEALATECLDSLRSQFKKSSRVTRLFGLYLEKKGRFEDAQAVYTQLLNDDPTDKLARKRMIAMLKAQKKIIEAIDGLRQYLNTFMSDFEAWNELADLYLCEGDYKHAAFCMEEMLLSNPHNHLYCQRYAEIKYTEGGPENLELARAYFAQACHLSPNNLRSLFGLLVTCSALDSNLGKGTDPLSLSATSGGPKEGKSYLSLLSSPSSTNDPGSLVSDEFPVAAAAAISGPERNRQLAKWASRQIRRIYQMAASTSSDSYSRQPSVTSASSPRIKSGSPDLGNHLAWTTSSTPSPTSSSCLSNRPIDVEDLQSELHHRQSSPSGNDYQ